MGVNSLQNHQQQMQQQQQQRNQQPHQQMEMQREQGSGIFGNTGADQSLGEANESAGYRHYGNNPEATDNNSERFGGGHSYVNDNSFNYSEFENNEKSNSGTLESDPIELQRSGIVEGRTNEDSANEFFSDSQLTASNKMDLISSLVSADMSTYEKLQVFKRLNNYPTKPNQPVQYTDSAFGFPLPPLTHSTIIMLDHRFPMNVERAIYRLSHLKLANPKRELRQQVLLSNFMYAYLNLVNHTLLLQNMEEGGGDPLEGGQLELEGREQEEFPVALESETDMIYN